MVVGTKGIRMQEDGSEWYTYVGRRAEGRKRTERQRTPLPIVSALTAAPIRLATRAAAPGRNRNQPVARRQPHFPAAHSRRCGADDTGPAGGCGVGGGAAAQGRVSSQDHPDVQSGHVRYHQWHTGHQGGEERGERSRDMMPRASASVHQHDTAPSTACLRLQAQHFS